MKQKRNIIKAIKATATLRNTLRDFKEKEIEEEPASQSCIDKEQMHYKTAQSKINENKSASNEYNSPTFTLSCHSSNTEAMSSAEQEPDNLFYSLKLKVSKRAETHKSSCVSNQDAENYLRTEQSPLFNITDTSLEALVDKESNLRGAL